MPVTKNAQSGFTLIEIISSIAILVLVLMVFLPLYPQTLGWTNSSEDQLVASNLLGRVAQDVKENQDALGLVSGEFYLDEVRVLSSEAGELSGLPEYPLPVVLTISFDEWANKMKVYVQVVPDDSLNAVGSYIYIDEVVWGEIF